MTEEGTPARAGEVAVVETSTSVEPLPSSYSQGQIPIRFSTLLSYVPYFFADMHAPALFGPPLYLLDVERMRNDNQLSVG
jgi:hypothetical protein